MKITKKLLIVLALGVIVTLLLNPSIFSDIVSGKKSTPDHSLSAMSAEIKRSIQKEFDKDEYYSNHRMKVQKVNLIETGKNSYNAYVDIEYSNAKKHTISADVHVSNDQYFWEFPAGTFLFLLEDPQEDSFHEEDEEDDSDADYYGALDRLKNDKNLYTASNKAVSASSKHTVENLYYPAIIPKKYKYAWVSLKVYVDRDGSVLSASVENAHYNATDDFKQSCIAAILNSRFARDTPNVIQLMYEYNADNLDKQTPAKANYTTIPNDVEVWILFGRNITKYAYPVYKAPVGFVQFEVVVDKDGNVIEADKYSVNKSSVPMDYIKACQAAAKHLKFEPADKASIITVSFSVKNN